MGVHAPAGCWLHVSLAELHGVCVLEGAGPVGLVYSFYCLF